MTWITNRIFDEITLGETATHTRLLRQQDIELFALVSGDVNPAHVDIEYAKESKFHHVIAHGMWGGALISAVLGTQLPGPGTIYVTQSLNFRRPVRLGDTVTVSVKVVEKRLAGHRLVLACNVVNQHGEAVIDGQAEVVAPTERISRPRVALPDIQAEEKGAGLRRLIEQASGLPPLHTAVIHPVDTVSLLGAVEAAHKGLIHPIFVGPEAKIRAAAEQAGLDLSPFDLVSTEHSDAAAAMGVALARSGKVEALMKGALHTDELLRAAVHPTTGLRTDRRMSHVFVVDKQGHSRPLFITDAAINIYPSLEDKRDIVQNAIWLANALGVKLPKVALLSAVETVSPAIKSTVDAAALCKMADRGQITGGILDGPLAFDNAVSLEAAQTKGINSPVAGVADIFVVPDLEAGNMLAKQLEYLAQAEVAGIVLGARVPIILTSRADKTLSRLGSCAVALLLVRDKVQYGLNHT